MARETENLGVDYLWSVQKLPQNCFPLQHLPPPPPPPQKKKEEEEEEKFRKFSKGPVNSESLCNS